MVASGLRVDCCLDHTPQARPLKMQGWIGKQPCFLLPIVVLLMASASSVFSQDTSTPQPPSVNNQTVTGDSTNAAPINKNAVSSDSERPKEFRPVDLPSVDQLVLVLSNATDPSGKNRQEVLVFLGRTKNRGWEKVGDGDLEELAAHWRSVAGRQMEQYVQAGLTSEQIEKVNLAVEVSIAQFQRLYHELRTDFLDQPDQKSRLAVLASDSRYERLRQLGREGLFRENSLVAKTINKALADAVQ